MLSIPHLIIIFIVALVVFGPQKLPELARNFGKIMAEFKRATADLRGTFEDHLRELERESQALEQKKLEAANAAAAPPGSVSASTASAVPPDASPPPASSPGADESFEALGEGAAALPEAVRSLESHAQSSSEAPKETAKDNARAT